jgi:integrase
MASIQERKNSKGEILYRVQVRLKGCPLQTATFARKTDAKKWAQHTEAAIREGRHFKTSEAKRHTLGELIDRYVRDVLPTKPKSQKKQTQQLNWWKNQIGIYSLADITPALIAEQRDRLSKEQTVRDKQRSPATVVRYLAALSHAFTVAIKEYGWIDSNPVAHITKPKEPRGRVRFLSDEEREKLLKAAQESDNPYLYLIIVLCLSTGARKMEILGLHWKDVDLMRGVIILHDTKNKERRVLPLVSYAMELMTQHSKVRDIASDLVFPSARNFKKPIDIRSAWESALKIAGIEDFRFHDLRHSAASYLIMNGASLAEIAEVLGHKTLQMVKRYAHLSEVHTMKVVAKMNEKIFGGENG